MFEILDALQKGREKKIGGKLKGTDLNRFPIYVAYTVAQTL